MCVLHRPRSSLCSCGVQERSVCPVRHESSQQRSVAYNDALGADQAQWPEGGGVLTAVEEPPCCTGGVKVMAPNQFGAAILPLQTRVGGMGRFSHKTRISSQLSQIIPKWHAAHFLSLICLRRLSSLDSGRQPPCSTHMAYQSPTPANTAD